MASKKIDKIKLVSSAGTGVYYTTTKKKGQPKLEKMKFDKKARKHVKFVESKIK